MIQQTLVLIKPDSIARGLIGEIIKRFEQRGLKIVGLKMIKPNKNLAEKHYTETITKKHGKHVRDSLLNYLTSSPVIAIAVQGSNAVELVRKITGSTFPGEADIGTIRGDFAHVSKFYMKDKNKPDNLIHASENKEDAKKELALWFSLDEIQDYKLAAETFIF
ncbi:nucleoside-diphosphate kinase [Candidatus Pacearchaeota archaeon]|nr:nucleoside-diphosphate kinase [Candidatus Pacearchaeota archaeon]MBD3283661.1 nucleoside-diphosphate kinase [Candidatus Pacearchaeota archaeon]